MFSLPLLQRCPGTASHLHTFVLNRDRFPTFTFLKKHGSQSTFYSRTYFILLLFFDFAFRFITFFSLTCLPILICLECDVK